MKFRNYKTMARRHPIKWTFDGYAYRKKNALPEAKEYKLTAKCLARVKQMVNELTEQTGYHPLLVMDSLEYAVNMASNAALDELEAQTGVWVNQFKMGVPTKADQKEYALNARIKAVAANIVEQNNTPEQMLDLLQPYMDQAREYRYERSGPLTDIRNDGKPRDMFDDIDRRLSQYQTQWLIEIMQRCDENGVNLEDLLIQES